VTKITKLKFALLGATALLASTSARAQVADSWTLGDTTVTSLNQADVKLDLNTDGTGISGANIQDGYKNSISGAAVGGSASSSFNYYNGSAQDGGATATIGSLNVVAGNANAVTNDATPGNQTPLIATGDGNSISLAAVGSSASTSATFSATGATGVTAATTYTVTGTTTVSSGDGIGGADATDPTIGGNTGDVSLILGTVAAPNIQAGNGNSISAASVGSSASLSLGINAQGGGNFAEVDFSLGGATVTSTNTGGSTIDADGAGGAVTIDTALIDSGNSNSISAAAIGASASLSVSDTAYSGGLGPIAAKADLGDVSVLSNNSGTISNHTDLTSAPTISDGTGNSISVAGIGSSASVSFSTTDYSAVPAVTALVQTAGTVGIASVNTGGVTVTSGFDTPTIAAGFNNSISAAAVGSSASQSISTLITPAGK